MVCCSMSSVRGAERAQPRLRQLARQRPQAGAVVLEASGTSLGVAGLCGHGIDLISTSAPVTRSVWLDLSMRFS